MRYRLAAGVLTLGLVAPAPSWAQPSTPTTGIETSVPAPSSEVETIKKQLQDPTTKYDLMKRMEDPLEKQKIMDLFHDPDVKENVQALFQKHMLSKGNDGRDLPDITPALPPPPIAAPKDDTLEPAVDDPARIVVSEKLLPPLEQPDGEPLLLDECLQKAFTLHPNLQIAIQAAVQAEANIRVVDASYVPQLEILADRNRQADPRIQQDTTIQLQLTHTLLDGGQRRKQLKSARAAFRASVRTFQNAWVTQVQAVTAAYILVLQMEFVEAIQADNLGRTNLNYQVTEAFYKGGLKSMIDVSTARVQQAQAQVSLATAHNDVKVARVQLAQAIGVPAEGVQNRPLDDRGILSSTPAPNRDTALSYLHAYHPALTSLTAQAASNFATAEAVRRANAPVLSALALYGNTGRDFPHAPDWQVELYLEFPFFSPDIGPKGDASEAAGHQLLEQRNSQEMLLIQQLDSSLANMDGARERARYAVQGVRQALLNAELAQKRYKVGLSQITELINARSFVESTRGDLILALADLKRSETLFLQSMGQVPIPPGVSRDSPLLQLQIEQFDARDKALKERRGPIEVPANKQ